MTEASENPAERVKEIIGDDDEATVPSPVKARPAEEKGTEISQPPTLRDFFDLPENGTAEGDDNWQAFQQKLAEETRNVKWTAAMPDLGSKICELLDIRIHDVMLTAWRKVEAVRQAIEDSKQTPDKATYLDLSEHSVDYESRPFIDVKIKSASVRKLTLTVGVNLNVKGFGLKVQNGAIREIQTGKCEGKGTIKYEKLSIAEKKLEPIEFPLSIEIPDLVPVRESAAKSLSGSSESKPATEGNLERIEF